MQQIIKLKRKIERNFNHKLKYIDNNYGHSGWFFIKNQYYNDMIFICEECGHKIIFYQHPYHYTINMNNSSYKKIPSCSEVIIKSIIE